MPIYEYKCHHCNREVEIFHKSSQVTSIPACPECSQDALARIISAAGFQLKGSGWYATDFKHNQTPTSSEHGSEPKADKSTESKKTDGSNGSSTAQTKTATSSSATSQET